MLKTTLQKLVISAPQTNLASKFVENQKPNISTKNIQPPDTRTVSQTPKLKPLRDFKIPYFHRKLNSTDTINRILSKSDLKMNNHNIDFTKETL